MAVLKFGNVLVLFVTVSLIHANHVQNQKDINNDAFASATSYSKAEFGPWIWPFSDVQKQAIVDTHNDLRRLVEPEASNMRKMVWDEDLAQLAQDWSENCSFEHTPDIDYGQNLATHADVIAAINSWYSEHVFYDYENDTCSQICGHYKQVVWATSFEVGCGTKECTGMSVTTCNYRPAGNYPSQPYQSGHYCSQCSNPSWCDQKLCDPGCKEDNVDICECNLLCLNCGLKVEENCTCTCKPGWNGIDCHDLCEDTDSRCGNGWPPMWCGVDEYDFVDDLCPLMCKHCDEGPYDPASHCCQGKECQQGVIDGRTCDCECFEGYGKEYECEFTTAPPTSTELRSEVTEHSTPGRVVTSTTPLLSETTDYSSGSYIALNIKIILMSLGMSYIS
ncbi:cysteine-rich secretory protein 1-like [Glandiceps talaboti]